MFTKNACVCLNTCVSSPEGPFQTIRETAEVQFCHIYISYCIFIHLSPNYNCPVWKLVPSTVKRIQMTWLWLSECHMKIKNKEMLARRVITRVTLAWKISLEIGTCPVCLPTGHFRRKLDCLHLLLTCVLVCLWFSPTPPLLQIWHHFLSSRPKVAKQLHLCQLSEKMSLLWLLLGLSLSYPPVMWCLWKMLATCAWLLMHLYGPLCIYTGRRGAEEAGGVRGDCGISDCFSQT